jgi:DNA sulfur modification protein DndB
MGNQQFGPLVDGDDIARELRVRTSNLEYKTIRGSKMKLILEKVAIEEKEGWSKSKRNSKSYKLSKPKPEDEKLEDELWCIVAKMGFKELSSGRNFTIETKKDPNPRQIDVFAKDDEVALIIECTQCATPTKKNMSKLIDKIASFKGGISKSITSYYGREKKIKPKFIIATRNVEWGKADIEKCKNEQISILTDTELDYYKSLTQFLKSAARYQFNAHLFAGADVPALNKRIPATRGTMGGVKFYNFLISPDDLLKISYVGHKASRSEDDIETYQRMLQPKRMKAIANYIDDGGKFPTNIVINMKTSRNRSLQFETNSPKDEISYGTLTLPNKFGTAWVIDGQHRLYGYAYRNMERAPRNDKSVLSVLAFENLPAKDEMDMFIDINSKQVKVQKGLLIELYSDLHWNSSNPEERLVALHSRIVSKLNTLKTSPIYDRVVVTGKKKSHDRCLTQATISDGLRAVRILGSVKKEIYLPGPIAHHKTETLELSLQKSIDIIAGTLLMFKGAVPTHWALGDRPGGYLCTNNAIRAIFHVMMDICNYVKLDRGGPDLSTWSSEDILDEIKVYIEPVIVFFRNASNEEFKDFRNNGSSLASVKKQSMGMNYYINEKFPDYSPVGLEEYLSSRDQEGNETATVLVSRIQKILFNHVIGTLKEEFPSDNEAWWWEVPDNVRADCTDSWNKEKGSKPRESYLYLINYQDIAAAHWGIFKDTMALGHKDIDNKKSCLKWIKELNDIRKMTAHPEKGMLTPEEIKFIEDLSDKVDAFISNKNDGDE